MASVRQKRLKTAFLLLLLAMGAGGVAALILAGEASRLLTERADAAIADDPDWEGTVGEISLDLWSATGTIQGVDVRAVAPGKVLRAVQIETVAFSFSLSTLWKGQIDLDAVATAATVSARLRPSRLPRPIPKVPAAGWFRFTVDATLRDSTWVWLDADDPDFEVRITDVAGTYTGLGTVEGVGHLDVEGNMPGQGTMRATGELDFLNAHGDAIDLRLAFSEVDLPALTDAGEHYLKLTLEQGVLDGWVGITIDPLTPQLEPKELYQAGALDDLEAGQIAGSLQVVDIDVGGLPLDAYGDRIQIDFEGPLTGRAPLSVQAAADGLVLVVRQSVVSTKPDAQTTPSEVLSTLPAFDACSVSLTNVRTVWIDDTHQPEVTLASQALDASIDNLQNIRSDDPATFEVNGPLAGGQLVVDGKVDLLSWPPPATLDASLLGVDAPAFVAAIAGYLKATAHRGVLHGRGTFEIDREGVVRRTLSLEGSNLFVTAQGWDVQAEKTRMEVFPGSGWITGLRVEPLDLGGAIRSATAETSELQWDMDRFLETRSLVATIAVDRPVVIGQRPKAIVESMRPEAEFELDITATNGRLAFHDTTVQPAIEVVLDPFVAEVESLGTASDKALWTLSGTLERGGEVQGWAEVDAFSGPGRSPGLHTESQITGLDLVEWSDVTKAYLGIGAEQGVADVSLAMDPEGGRLGVETRELAMSFGGSTAAANTVQAQFSWTDALGERGRILTGKAQGAEIVIDATPTGGPTSEIKLDTVSQGLPTLLVPHLDIRDSTVTVIGLGGAQTPLRFEDADLALRQVSLGAHGETGDVWLNGSLFEGTIALQLASREQQPHSLRFQASDLNAALANPWIRPAAGIDISEGEVSILGNMALGPSGLNGDVETTFAALDVFGASDWKRGPVAVLRDGVLGAALGLASRDKRAVVRVHIGGTLSEPEVRPIQALGTAILVRHGIRKAQDLPLDAPTAMPLPITDPGSTAELP